MAVCHIISANVSGKKFFHTRCMSWSYRNRGYEARTHKNKADSRAALIIILMVVSSGNIGRLVAPINKMADSVFINRMLAYSARKNSANGPPAYSTLKPETSSDSPSVRSKGARFVSASVETNHIAAKGQAGARSQMLSCVTLNIVKVNPPVNTIVERRMSPSATSYEMVWATARRAPISAYLELDAHPEPRME